MSSVNTLDITEQWQGVLEGERLEQAELATRKALEASGHSTGYIEVTVGILKRHNESKRVAQEHGWTSPGDREQVQDMHRCVEIHIRDEERTHKTYTILFIALLTLVAALFIYCA